MQRISHHHLTSKFAVLGWLALAVVSSETIVIAADIMSPDQADRLGLVEAWRRQAQVPFGAQSIVDQQVYVLEDSRIEFVEVIGTPLAAGTVATAVDVEATATKPTPQDAKVYARFRVDGTGAVGTSMERPEAERRGRQQMRVLARRGIQGEMTVRTVPSVRLYTLGDDGTVQCQNAETGEVIWLSRYGDRNRGYGNLGVSDNVLSVINGSDLIQVDANSGEEIESVRMTNIPIFGAIHAGDYSLVPLIRGGVECYALHDNSRDPWMELVQGRTLAMPVKSPDFATVAWGTDQSFVYVIELSGKPSMQFRLHTDGIVSGKLAAAAGRRFFFGSEAGQVYAIRATRTGEVLWSKPFGEPFYNQPLVYNDSVLIRSTYGSLYCLNIDSGIMMWDDVVAGVDELLACFDGKVYVRLLSGIFAAIDLKSGDVIEATASIQPRRILPNFLTDRLYLVDESGLVQCVKPIGSDLPVVNPVLVAGPGEAVETGTSPNEKKAEAADPKSTDDPFGAEAADPFGEGGEKAGDDPFGGGDDPFGGTGDDADPFAE